MESVCQNCGIKFEHGAFPGLGTYCSPKCSEEAYIRKAEIDRIRSREKEAKNIENEAKKDKERIEEENTLRAIELSIASLDKNALNERIKGTKMALAFSIIMFPVLFVLGIEVMLNNTMMDFYFCFGLSLFLTSFIIFPLGKGLKKELSIMKKYRARDVS